MIPGVDCYTIGLDIGRVRDYSAICVLARHYRPLQPGEIPLPGHQMAVIHTAIEGCRFPLHTPMEMIAEYVDTVWHRPMVQAQKRFCVMDMTGVGAPVLEMIRGRHIRTIGVNITSGAQVTRGTESDTYNVPKSSLVTIAKQHAERGLLKIAIEEGEARELEYQLRNFDYKINKDTGAVSYEAAKEKIHDDLILSVAIALWWSATQVKGIKYRMDRREAEIQEENDPFARRK